MIPFLLCLKLKKQAAAGLNNNVKFYTQGYNKTMGKGSNTYLDTYLEWSSFNTEFFIRTMETWFLIIHITVQVNYTISPIMIVLVLNI